MSERLTDARRLWVALRDAGTEGVHSHAIRKMGLSGNPSSRCKDIVSRGVGISTRRESVGRRPGSRYWLAEHAPADAIAVLPNRASGRTCKACGASIDHLRADATTCSSTCRREAWEAERPDGRRTPSDPAVAVHIRSADESVASTEPLAIVRDWDGSWSEIPVSELDLGRAA